LITKRLILMRGLPGSGKSTKAKAIPHARVMSTDDYWIRPDGKYDWNAKLIFDAHRWNQRRVEESMQFWYPTIVVDNTNIRIAHMLPYYDLAREYSYEVDLMWSDTSWAWDPEECMKRCTHNVPLESIKKMLEDYEVVDGDALQKLQSR